jgi:hypothetical protein
MDADARIPDDAGKRNEIQVITFVGEHDGASVKG